MKKLIVFSLLLIIAVLIPVCAGLITDVSWAQASYGAATPARGILLSVYLSILIASFLLLAFRDPRSVAALLTVQILYKITTPVTVGAFDNPVVISNLWIAVFYAITLLVIWRAMGNPFRKRQSEKPTRRDTASPISRHVNLSISEFGQTFPIACLSSASLRERQRKGVAPLQGFF